MDFPVSRIDSDQPERMRTTKIRTTKIRTQATRTKSEHFWTAATCCWGQKRTVQSYRKASNMKFPINQTVSCQCQKVKLAINSPDVLRLVCYCKDCRGYYNTLNKETTAAAIGASSPPAAKLDEWGGCDYVHVQPNEVTVQSGQEFVKVSKIREKSPIHRVYTTCCHTPLFTIGPSKTVLLNSHLLSPASTKPDVSFRIIGRDAIKKDKNAPKMSWSVPLAWFYTMPGRGLKDPKASMPVELPAQPDVLKNFQRG
jgi:hypothetical protein